MELFQWIWKVIYIRKLFSFLHNLQLIYKYIYIYIYIYMYIVINKDIQIYSSYYFFRNVQSSCPIHIWLQRGIPQGLSKKVSNSRSYRHQEILETTYLIPWVTFNWFEECEVGSFGFNRQGNLSIFLQLMHFFSMNLKGIYVKHTILHSKMLL